MIEVLRSLIEPRHRKNIDWVVILCVVLVMFASIATIYSASAGHARDLAQANSVGFKQALRVGNWKYVKPALYDLAQDLNETTDLAKQFPEIVSRMETLLLSVRTESPDFPVRR